ncbi:MAG: isoaspartyl peptidase/L-asparaginase, partial [Gammaproteobacteria bacterium]
PISIARGVMEKLPHVLLVGAGAERFGREIGALQSDNLIDDSRKAWERWFETEVSVLHREQWSEAPLAEYCKDAIDPETGRDTTVFIAMDDSASLGVGVSTSGWGWKYPGRLGDSPIIGAGSYADSRYGACACTGAGEMALRVSAARSAVLYMKTGLSVSEALYEVADDMRALQGGLIDRITLHAIDTGGNHQAIAVNAVERHHYWYWNDSLREPEKRYTESVEL